MMSSTDRVIQIPLLEPLKSNLRALEANKKKKKSTRKAVEKIRKYLPEMEEEYAELYALVGHKLRLIPTLTFLIKEWARLAGQHLSIELLPHPPAPRYQAKLLTLLNKNTDQALVNAEKDSEAKASLSESLGCIETLLDYTIELRMLQLHQGQIDQYCRTLYENFCAMRREAEQNLADCQRLEGQIISSLVKYRIITPDQADRLGPAGIRFRGEAVREDRGRPSAYAAERPVTVQNHAAPINETESEKPSWLMRIWLFLKKIVVGILNFLRKIPPISWLFPLKSEADEDDGSSEDIAPDQVPAAPQPAPSPKSFSTAYRSARKAKRDPASGPDGEPETPKTLRNRAR